MEIVNALPFKNIQQELECSSLVFHLIFHKSISLGSNIRWRNDIWLKENLARETESDKIISRKSYFNWHLWYQQVIGSNQIIMKPDQWHFDGAKNLNLDGGSQSGWKLPQIGNFVHRYFHIRRVSPVFHVTVQRVCRFVKPVKLEWEEDVFDVDGDEN